MSRGKLGGDSGQPARMDKEQRTNQCGLVRFAGMNYSLCRYDIWTNGRFSSSLRWQAVEMVYCKKNHTVNLLPGKAIGGLPRICLSI